MGRKKELLHTFQLSYKWQSSKEVLLSWFLEVISKGGKLNSEIGILYGRLCSKGKKIIFYTRNIFFDWKFGYFFPETDALAICEKWMLAIITKKSDFR